MRSSTALSRCGSLAWRLGALVAALAAVAAFTPARAVAAEPLSGVAIQQDLRSFGQVATQLEEIGKQNMEMFTKAFSMFTPFVAPDAATTKKK
jgi:polyhydroxyalkanoate synthesis regulator protein